MNFHNDRVEARVGIEPTYKGFADLSLTTWVPRPGSKYSESRASFQPGKPGPRPIRSESGFGGRFAGKARQRRVEVDPHSFPILFYVEFVGETGLHRLHHPQDVT